MGKYGRLLNDLHSHLTEYGERHWSPILQQWIVDLEQLERVQTPISEYAAHLSRTKQSFGGMGSLNDVAITPQGGYNISSWKSRGVNTKLHKLTTDLYSETLRLLSELEPPKSAKNPVRDTATSPRATAPQETYAYDLTEIQQMLSVMPEPAATIFAVAAFTGRRRGELQGLRWEDYEDGQIRVSRAIWEGHVNDPKTGRSKGAVPVIRHVAERLEFHRMRCGNSQTGPMFRNLSEKPLCLNNVLGRQILPALKRCETYGAAEGQHAKAKHAFKLDEKFPKWHGWHAARRGLGSNLYALGVPEKVIQQILRHTSVSTTSTYYIKTVPTQVTDAMEKLQQALPNSLSGNAVATGTWKAAASPAVN